MKQSLKTALTSLLMVLCASLLFTVSAFATSATVTGQPYYGTDYVQFVIEGSGDQTFFDLMYGSEYKARHVQCKFDEGENAVGWDVAAGEDPLQYKLIVYSGRDPSSDPAAVTTGVTGIYADLDGAGVLMAVCPGGAAGFTPNATYYDAAHGDYDLADPTGTTDGEGNLHFAYTKHIPAALTGSVSYVDETGAVLEKIDLAGVTAANPVPYAIPATLTYNNETYYPTVRNVEAKYDGQIDFVVLCNRLKHPGEGAYKALIRMVDENGKLLMTDSVNVSRVFTYSVPQTFVLTSAGSATSYTLRLGAGEGSVLTLRPGDAGADPTKEYTYTYAGHIDNTAVDWTIRQMNGATGAQIGTDTVSVQPGETATYDAANLTVDGQTFEAAGDKTYTYTYGGANLVQTIYYVPAGYQAEGDRTVTLQYLNIADNSVLHTEQITVAPGQDTTINTQASFGDYVRLNGQSDSYRHSYYSPKSVYTVYYRNINDTLYADTVITLTQTVTTTRTQENVVTLPTVDGGTTTDGTAGGTTYVAGPTAGEELTAANNDATGQSDLLTENGDDTAGALDEIISENETPLAQGTEGQTAPDGTTDNAEDTMTARPASALQTVGLVGLGALAILLIVLILLQVKKRRGNGQ